MNIEELLKSISGLIKKNEQFFIDNIELFKAVEDRLHKAADDDEDEYNPYNSDEADYGQYEGGSDLFDDVPQDKETTRKKPNQDDEQDMANDWLDANDPDRDSDDEETLDEDEAYAAEEPQAEEPQALPEEAPPINVEQAPEKSKRASNLVDWQPQDEYAPHHQESINSYMDDGYSHREAERMSGAGSSPTDFNTAMSSGVRHSQPSAKLLETIKGHVNGWLSDTNKRIDSSASAGSNPNKYTSAKRADAREGLYDHYDEALKQFQDSDEVKGLSGMEKYRAVKNFKKQYHAENPEHRGGIAANSDKSKDIHKEAKHQRAKKLLDDNLAIDDSSKVGGELTTASEFSTSAAGGTEGLTSQGVAQSAGGSQNEGGYSIGTVKDPAAIFSENKQDYLKSEQRKKSIEKLKSQLHPEHLERYHMLTGAGKKDGE